MSIFCFLIILRLLGEKNNLLIELNRIRAEVKVHQVNYDTLRNHVDTKNPKDDK
jgi:hypothetical protein